MFTITIKNGLYLLLGVTCLWAVLSTSCCDPKGCKPTGTDSTITNNTVRSSKRITELQVLTNDKGDTLSIVTLTADTLRYTSSKDTAIKALLSGNTPHKTITQPKDTTTTKTTATKPTTPKKH